MDVAACSGNAHDWVVLREIQGKCAGQISRWLVVSSLTRVVECQPAQWHASCACFRSSRSFRCFDDGKAHCINAFEKGCPFPTVPDHCKGQSLERSSCYIVLIVLWSSWQFMYGPRLYFLEGAHDWANVFVLCISHCLVLKQVLKEEMGETIGTYSTKTYSKLHSIDIRTGNTKDGWKKHGINRQPFFWFGTSRSKIMTKIPKESADQKDIVWYYHGSCMPKTAMVQDYSSWREHMIEQMCSCFAFPTAWFWNRSWKRFLRETIETYSTKAYSKLHSFDIRTGNTKDGWKKHGINRQPFFWFGTPSNKITYDQDS